ESGYIAVRPDDPNVVYAGSYGGLTTRYDHRTRQTRNVSPWPDNPMGYGAGDLKYCFQWTFPIVLSPHDPNVLYATANVVFRSTDGGASWDVVSPDLTRDDPGKMGPSGGPITRDNTSVEYYGTIFAFAESPVERGVLWAGSDDCRPYLLKTNDYGKSWEAIADGIPVGDFTRAMREDPQVRGLLYAGTETGVYVSFDDGGAWQRLGGNLPIVPIHDLVVKDGDL